MWLFVWNTTPSKIFKWNTPVKSVWVWTTKVRPNNGIFHNTTLWLISISSDWNNWITIADKNLGATQVYNDWDVLSESNCWYYYQWWNNYGFPFTWSVTTSSTQIDTTGYWPWNYYNSSIFIIENADWSSTRNSNLWGWETWTTSAMQWPCPEQFHIPLKSELETLINIIKYELQIYSGTAAKIYLKMPLGWCRNFWTSEPSSQNAYWHYWTTTDYGVGAYIVQTEPTTFNITWQYKGIGYSIRPFKNTPVIPDDTRTKLF